MQQLPSLSDGGGVGWFLDRIDVTGPEGRHWTFPCSAWLGRSNHPAGLDGGWVCEVCVKGEGGEGAVQTSW